MSEGISAPALVYCNCTKEKEISDAAEENFEIYQYLTVDPDGDRNIFCTDYPFIFDEDCKPYINIKPFPFCRSRFYEEAVKNLEEYASRKCIEAENEGNTTEAVVWGQRASEFHNICLNVQQQKMLSEKQYPCLLQVLDRWFNSTKATVTEYFNWSKETWQNLERIQKTFMQVIQKARKKLKDGQPGFIETAWERFNRAFEAIKPDFDNIIIDEFSDSFYFDLEQIKREWHAAWNEKTEDPLSGFDRKTKSMSKVIELLSDMVCDELFFADHQELVSKNMERVRDIFQDFYEAVSELDYDDDLDFRAILEQFKTDLNGLQFKVEFRDTQKDFISKNSFLVCRCGGIIRVVYSGQDMDRGFYKLESNVVKFLQWIERDFHTLITETTLWDYWRVGVSFVDAYNFVRFILLSSGNASQFDTYYHAIYRDRVMRGYGAEMNITIKSASSKNKEEHNKSALLNLISASVGAVTFDMSAGIQIAAAAAMVRLDPNSDNFAGLGAAVAGASSDELISSARACLKIAFW